MACARSDGTHHFDIKAGQYLSPAPLLQKLLRLPGIPAGAQRLRRSGKRLKQKEE
jgi:hypothetical protein